MPCATPAPAYVDQSVLLGDELGQARTLAVHEVLHVDLLWLLAREGREEARECAVVDEAAHVVGVEEILRRTLARRRSAAMVAQGGNTKHETARTSSRRRQPKKRTTSRFTVCCFPAPVSSTQTSRPRQSPSPHLPRGPRAQGEALKGHDAPAPRTLCQPQRAPPAERAAGSRGTAQRPCPGPQGRAAGRSVRHPVSADSERPASAAAHAHRPADGRPWSGARTPAPWRGPRSPHTSPRCAAPVRAGGGATCRSGGPFRGTDCARAEVEGVRRVSARSAAASALEQPVRAEALASDAALRLVVHHAQRKVHDGRVERRRRRSGVVARRQRRQQLSGGSQQRRAGADKQAARERLCVPAATTRGAGGRSGRAEASQGW
jgi:hypothetical protein